MTAFKGNNDYKMGIFEEQTYSRLRKCSKRAFCFFDICVGNSRVSDEERAQMTTGAYNEVRDREVRKGDKVSRDGYYQREVRI